MFEQVSALQFCLIEVNSIESLYLWYEMTKDMVKAFHMLSSMRAFSLDSNEHHFFPPAPFAQRCETQRHVQIMLSN